MVQYENTTNNPIQILSYLKFVVFDIGSIIMSLVIRLAHMGKKGERKFRVVVKEKRSKRDGKAVEMLGWYEKTEKGINKNIDKKKFDYWISKGAKPSQVVSEIVSKA